MDQARRAIRRGEARAAPPDPPAVSGVARGTAMVLGAGGRVGAAFARRLARDGWRVLADPAEPDEAGPGALLFDCAYADGEPDAHVARVRGRLARWRRYAAVFVPSSLWAGQDTPYGRAKREVERLAADCVARGGRVVVDSIGYFPGDGAGPDPAEPMGAALVTGEALYARVMARMLATP